MTSNQDISNRIEEIHYLVALNEISKAVKRLLDFVRDFSIEKNYMKEVIIISANYNQLETDLRMDFIRYEEAQVRRNKILYQMLSITDQIHERTEFSYA